MREPLATAGARAVGRVPRKGRRKGAWLAGMRSRGQVTRRSGEGRRRKGCPGDVVKPPSPAQAGAGAAVVDRPCPALCRQKVLESAASQGTVLGSRT